MESATESAVFDIQHASLGDSLKKMRELRELTKEEVSRRLRLRQSLIDLMESNAFPGELSEIFARGYLKSYARLLQFSESDIEAMLASLQFLSPTGYRSSSDQSKILTTHRVTYTLTGMTILIIIALLIGYTAPTYVEQMVSWFS